MAKYTLFALFMLLCAACSSLPTYSETLQPWIGQSEQRLRQSWGTPHNVFYVTSQEKVVTYLFVSARPRNDNSHPYSEEFYYPAVAAPDYGFPAQPQYTNYYCKTSFTIRNGIIINYSFNGDDCVAAER